MKVCIKCKEEKELIEYYKHPKTKDGYLSSCIICKKEYDKNYCIKNKCKRIKVAKDWKQNNIEISNKYFREYCKKRRLTEPLYKLKCNIRNLIRSSIIKKGYAKKSKTYVYLGCSYDEFKIHLERQFAKGMTWQNTHRWHLDHIYPVSLAKDEEELIKLNHYTNFQPLWAADNLKKGNKIIEKQLVLI